MSWLSTLVGAGGSLLSGVFGASGAEKQRRWEEQMANTQYQRSSADMIKAGLNPMMMFMRGGGAGAIPQLPPNPGAELGSGVATAAKQAAIDIPLAVAQVSKLGQDAKTSASQELVNRSSAVKIDNDAILSAQEQHINLMRLQQMAKEMDLTDQQTRELNQRVSESVARIAELNSRAKLNNASARQASVEADAAETLKPAIDKGSAGVKQVLDYWFGKSEDREDISYIRDQARSRAPAGSQVQSGPSSAKGGQQQAQSLSDLWNWWIRKKN